MNEGEHLVREAPYDAFLCDLAMLGVQPDTAPGFEYGVIHARGNERWWLVPMVPAKASVAGLGMFQPANQTARLAKAGAITLMRLGLTQIWARNKAVFSRLPDIYGNFRGEVAFCAYFTGTAGPHRKTAIQFMDKDANILGYCKISRMASIRKYIANEAKVLDLVGKLHLRSAHTPECLHFSDQAGASYLVTDSRKTTGHKSSLTLGPLHYSFLKEVAKKTRGQSLEVTLGCAKQRVDDLQPGLSAPWQARLHAGLTYLTAHQADIPTALAHGDFTPWNCFAEVNTLYVFDWEYAQTDYPLGYDVIHFLLSLLGVDWSGNILDFLIPELIAVFYRDDRNAASHAILCALLLHSVFYLSRVLEIGEPESEWHDNAKYASWIDSVLESLINE